MRKKYINSIIESMHRIKQEVCFRISRVPDLHITPSEWALLTVVHQDDGVSAKKIAEKMGVTMSAVSQLLRRLEKDKIIGRTTDPLDKRSVCIKLAPKSRKMIEAMEVSVSEGMSSMFSVLSDKELQTLAELNKKISDSIRT